MNPGTSHRVGGGPPAGSGRAFHDLDEVGPAHLVRVVDGQLRVGHPRSCPRWPALDDDGETGHEYRCGVTLELETPGAREALLEYADGQPEFLIEFWNEWIEPGPYHPESGYHRSGLRILL